MSEDSEYVCTLDAASIKKARDELNEIPEDRLAAVQAFRDWIKEQPHIQCGKLDTLTLLSFLRGCKFSQVKAREKLENSLRMKVDFPDFFGVSLDPTSQAMREILRTGYMFPLPKRTPEGSLVVMMLGEGMAKMLGPMKMSVKQMYQFSMILMNYLGRSEMTQVNGTVFFTDFTGIKLSLMTKTMTPETSKIEKMLMKSLAGRFKGFHCYRAGLFIDMMMAFYKPFMPKKWMDRIKLHDNMETMYRHVGMECLPVEYLPDDYTGPNAGTIPDILKAFEEEVTSDKFREELMYRTGSDFSIDDSKKPQEVVTQHFRKLTVE